MTSHPKSPRTTGNEAGFGMMFDVCARCVHDLFQFYARAEGDGLLFYAVAVYTVTIPDGIAFRAF